MNGEHRAALFAGVLAGISGLLVFLVVHALWIAPIWFILPLGLVIAGIGGAAVGRAYAEVAHRLPQGPWRVPAVAALVSLLLAPSVFIAEARTPIYTISESGVATLTVSVAGVAWRFFSDLLAPATVSGALAGAWLGQSRRAAVAMAVAAFVVALGPGHNIPFLGGTAGAGRGAAILVLVNVVSAAALVEAHRWLQAAASRAGRLVAR